MILKKILLTSACAFFALSLYACSPITEIRGNLVEDRKLVDLTIGETTQRQALQTLGSPTATSTLDKNEWYYVGQKTEQFAIFEADIVDRNVVVLKFNDESVLESINTLDENDGTEIAVVGRETESSGRKFTLMQQLIGNLGRFNPGQGQ